MKGTQGLRGLLISVLLLSVALVVRGVEEQVTNTENDACSAHGDCTSCTKQNGCGWCGFPPACKAGNSSGDHEGTCYLSWLYDKPCPDCSSFKTCDTCLDTNYLCGWCGPSQSCITPSYDKQDNKLVAPGCKGDFSNGMEVLCPECSRGKSCRECAQLDDEAGRCGWCDSRQACVQGDSEGPYAAEHCSPWNYLSCTYCQLHDTCYDCTLDSNCAWCPSAEGSTKCLVLGTNHTLDCNGSWVGLTSKCDNPYPWLPGGSTINNEPDLFSFNVVNSIAIGCGAIFGVGFIAILVYLGVRKYRRVYGYGYSALPSNFSVST